MSRMPLKDFINLTHAYAWHQARLLKNTPDEPGLISAFIAPPMLDRLEQLIARMLPGTDVLLNGIFTHKTPTVRPLHAGNSVEIGDMLFIRQHFSLKNGVPPTGRAFLIQAKCNSKPQSGSLASGNPKIQYELYRDWPKFNGTSRISPTAPDGKYWDFSNVMLSNPGFYTVVFDRNAYDLPTRGHKPIRNKACNFSGFPKNSTWSYGEAQPGQPAKSGVHCNDSFADLLHEFIHDRVGVPFIPGSSDPSNHWSAFVNEMLDVASSSSYTYRSASTGILKPVSRNGRLPVLSPVVRFLYQHCFHQHPGWNLLPFLFNHEEVLYTLLDWQHNSSRYGIEKPPNDSGELPPFYEPGHPSILSLITIGKEQ